MLLWPFNKYPGTDYETFNWEWILATVKEYKEKVDAFIAAMTDKWNTFKNFVTNEIAEMHRNFAIYVNVTEKALNTGAIADGAITKQKIDSDFLEELENAYVTPEMFGAIGDGIQDDTTSVQKMFNSENEYFMLTSKYKISSAITISNKADLRIIGGELIGNGVITDSYITIENCDDIIIDGLKIDTMCDWIRRPRGLISGTEYGNMRSVTPNAIRFDNCSNGTVKNLLSKHGLTGMTFSHCSNMTCINCRAEYTMADGFECGSSCHDMAFYNCSTIHTNDDAYSANNYGTDSTTALYNIKYDNCTADYMHTGRLFCFSGSHHIMAENCVGYGENTALPVRMGSVGDAVPHDIILKGVSVTGRDGFSETTANGKYVARLIGASTQNKAYNITLENCGFYYDNTNYNVRLYIEHCNSLSIKDSNIKGFNIWMTDLVWTVFKNVIMDVVDRIQVEGCAELTLDNMNVDYTATDADEHPVNLTSGTNHTHINNVVANGGLTPPISMYGSANNPINEIELDDEFSTSTPSGLFNIKSSKTLENTYAATIGFKPGQTKLVSSVLQIYNGTEFVSIQ